MSEYLAITLVLGIIGTLTGVFALFISYWTYSQERPKLKVNIKRCEHKQEKTFPEKVSFMLDFSIHNRGNRSTTLNEIELNFVMNGQKYSLKKSIERYSAPLNASTKVNVEACRTIDQFVWFEDIFKGLKEIPDTIECHYILYHTHKAYHFKATSKKTWS